MVTCLSSSAAKQQLPPSSLLSLCVLFEHVREESANSESNSDEECQVAMLSELSDSLTALEPLLLWWLLMKSLLGEGAAGEVGCCNVGNCECCC